MKKNLLCLSFLALLFGCVKEEINLQNLNSDSFDPSFAIPLGTATLQMGRLNSQTNNFFQINPTTGLLEFAFTSESFGYGMADFNLVPNQSFVSSTSMNSTQVAAFNLVPQGSTYNFQTTNPVSIIVPSSELLDSVLINSGTLTIGISSSYTHSMSIIVTIPSLTFNGTPYSATIPLVYSSSVPVTTSIALPLAGYTLNLTDGGSANNTLRVNYNTTLTKGSTAATTSQSVDFNTNIVLNNIREVHGYFGNRSFTQNDTLDTEIFGELTDGTVSFADPRLELRIVNRTGISFDANFTSITAWQNTTNQNLGGPGLTSIPTILKATTIGDSSITNHIINNGNTTPTITTILNEKPERLAYSTSVQMNPGGVTNNFITSNSRLSAQAKIVVPLNGYGTGFTINDTSSTRLEDIIGLDSAAAENLRSLTVRVIATNGMPLEAGIQVYFLDANNVVLDSLFADGYNSVLSPGTVNFSVPTTDPGYGKVQTPAKRTFDISMTKDQYQRLIANGQTKMAYQSRMTTIGGSTMRNIKIFPEDYITLKISAKLDLRISIN